MAIAADCKSAPIRVRGFESLSSHKYKKLPINHAVERGNGCAAIADLAGFSSGFPWSL